MPIRCLTVVEYADNGQDWRLEKAASPSWDRIVASIRRGGAAKEWPDQPLAGSLFACEPGVRGLREPKFRG